MYPEIGPGRERPGKLRGYAVGVVLVMIALVAIGLPFARNWWMKANSEEVTVSRNVAPGVAAAGSGLDLDIITVLSKDAIPAIDEPRFLTGAAAEAQMLPGERLLGVVIDGEARAYPLKMLSRHEIVNDEVAGVPIAVTW